MSTGGWDASAHDLESIVWRLTEGCRQISPVTSLRSTAVDAVAVGVPVSLSGPAPACVAVLSTRKRCQNNFILSDTTGAGSMFVACSEGPGTGERERCRGVAFFLGARVCGGNARLRAPCSVGLALHVLAHFNVCAESTEEMSTCSKLLIQFRTSTVTHSIIKQQAVKHL